MFAKFCIAALLPLVAFAQAPTSWTPELAMKVKGIADVTPSPDGKTVIWTETHAVMDGDKSEMNAQVFYSNADGSGRIQLTRGAKSANAPQFSNDGKFVFFASDRGSGRQVFRIPVDGGEAEQLTSFGGAVAQFQLSPDGKWIAFTGREKDLEDERAKREKRDLHVLDEDPKNLSLWLTPVDHDIRGKRSGKKVGDGPYSVGQFDWSADSRRIAYETRPTPNADDGRKADLLEVTIETGGVRPLAATSLTESSPRYSPDGRFLAFTRSREGASRIGGTRIVLLSLKDGKMRELPPTADEGPALADWAKDSSRIFFTEGKGTRGVIYAMPVDGPPVAVFAPAKGTFGFGIRMNRSGTYAGFAFQSSSEAVEAYVLALNSATPVRVSEANTNLPKLPIGETRLIHWKSKDGKEIEGLLTLPVGYQNGKRYPLILNIHGGPAGAFNEQFIGASGLYPIATFAAKGWATLRANPRGSTAYGLAFRAANYTDWGNGDYQDLMTGVDYVIQQGIADPNKLAVMGWSYGGYMTNWVVGHTTRFKCAAAGAGLSNMISMYGTNDIPSTLDDYFDGAWFEQADRYVQQSPLFYIKNVTTPLLVLHGAQDFRVPTTQGYEMYEGVKRHGVEAKMVVYPRTPHGPQEPKFVLDVMQRHVDWVAKHIGE
ncbi:MAG: S9 family peptidase [Bryobacteraceae bacterium]